MTGVGRRSVLTMDGVVTVVQESRFQLTDDAGVSHLFILSPDAAAEPDQLAAVAEGAVPREAWVTHRRPVSSATSHIPSRFALPPARRDNHGPCIRASRITESTLDA